MAKNVSPNALMLYNKFLELGVAPGTAAGAVGSMIGESGEKLNPAAINPKDGRDGSDSIGMGQWNQGRATALRRTAEQMGTSWTDPRAQIAHVGNELQGSHRHVLKALLAAGDDVRAGNDIWTKQYEVPTNAGAVARARLGDGIRFAGQIGAMSPEQISAITAQSAQVPAEPARGNRAAPAAGPAPSTREIAQASGFNLGPDPLAGMIALGGPTNSEPTKPVAQVASADKSQADALAFRALTGATPPATQQPIQAAQPAPIAVAEAIGTTPGSAGNPFGALATPVQMAAPVAPAEAKPATNNEAANPFGALATPVQNTSPQAKPAAAPEFKWNDKAEAPASVRFEVDALSKPEDQLAALRKHYPTAMPYQGDNFQYQNEKGEWQKYNNPGWIPSTGDIAGAAPLFAEMIGGGLGAAGGGIAGAAAAGVGAVPGAMAGAAAGGTAAREAAQRGINWYYGNNDTRTTGEQVTDAAITAGTNAVGEGLGRAIIGGAKAAGRGLGFGTQAATEAATDMRAIGIEPTVGMVTGNAPTQYAERAIGAIPGLGNSINRAAESSAAAIAAENDRIVSGIASSTNRNATAGTAQEVGAALKQEAANAQTRFQQAANQQYENVGALTGSTPVPGNSMANLGFELAQESANITAFGRETYGSELKAAMRRVSAINEDIGNGANFESIKRARTEVGKMQRTSTNDAEQAYLGRMYDALTAEMGATADAAGNGARTAWNEADAAYRAGMAKGSPTNVKENLAPVLTAKVDEDVLTNMLKGNEKGGNRIAAARRQILQGQGNEAWDQFTAATVERLGSTTDGFSSSKFLKGWNDMSPEAKGALFDGTANEAYRADLDRLARIAANVKRYGKSANGSNTSNVQTIVGALGAIGVPVGGVLAGNTALVMSSLGSMATTGTAAKIGDRLLTNPTVVSLVANLPRAQVQRGGVARTIAALHQYAGSPGVDDATRSAIIALAEAIDARNEKKAK
ncbi:phage tail tip lysozyme [Methylorubrum extorquens]